MVSFIEAATAQGLNVATFKKTHPSVSMDIEGTDTFKFSAAGAQWVGMQQDNGFYWHEQRETGTLDKEIARHVSEDTELILIEGYDKENYPKISLDKAGEKLENLTNVLLEASIFDGNFDTDEKRKAWFKTWLSN